MKIKILDLSESAVQEWLDDNPGIRVLELTASTLNVVILYME